MGKLLRPSVMRSSEWFKRETRDKEEWDRIRTQVKERDNWTCVYCGFRSKKFMQVNHINEEDNHDIANLETVCNPCHSVLHMGINSMNGILSVITSSADQAEIVRATRQLVHRNTPWPVLEQTILAKFLAPGGKVYSREESVMWANKMLASVPQDGFRGYLPDGLAVIFHEEGPWQNFPEAVYKWGKRNS